MLVQQVPQVPVPVPVPVLPVQQAHGQLLVFLITDFQQGDRFLFTQDV